MNICLFSPEELTKPLPARDERAVHIKKVLKKTVDQTFAAGIIEGPAGLAAITKIGGENNDGDIYFSFEPYKNPAQAAGKMLSALDMVIGFPRPIQLKRLLRDMAALGVQSVRLAGTELGEKSYLKASLSQHAELYKMLLEGTMQAGGTHIPKDFVYSTLEECLKDFPDKKTDVGTDVKIALDNVRAQDGLVNYLQNTPLTGRRVIAAVGSERGWSDNERVILERYGFIRLEMGERIMRTETAATVSASLILAAMGHLG